MPEQISTVALLGSVTTVALAIIGVVLREHWKKTLSHDERLRVLETSSATREDINRVHSRIEEMGKKLDSQHHATMQTLLDMTARLP